MTDVDADDALRVTQEQMDACCPCRSAHPCCGGKGWICACWKAHAEKQINAGVLLDIEACRWPGHAARRRRDAARDLAMAERAYEIDCKPVRIRGGSDDGNIELKELRDAARKAFEEVVS